MIGKNGTYVLIVEYAYKGFTTCKGNESGQSIQPTPFSLYEIANKY